MDAESGGLSAASETGEPGALRASEYRRWAARAYPRW